jgi:hypothetical protein
VVRDQRVDLAGHRPVRTHARPDAGDDRDDRLVTVGLEVAGDPEGLEQAVDPAVLRVLDAGLGDQRLDGCPPDDGCAARRESPTPVDTDHQRGHAPREAPAG